MPLRDGIPPFAEQITINQVEETLSNFKQLIPEGFVELEQLNHMCSTQGGKEPTCERYNCLINGEGKQVDIRHALLEELGLEKDISNSVYISPVVLDRGLDRYLAYNVENEAEIFIRKSFTAKNLREDVGKLFEKIAEQEQKLTQKDNEIKRLEEERDARPNITLDQGNNDYSRRPTQQQLSSVQQELRREKTWWDKWMTSKEELLPLKHSEYYETRKYYRDISGINLSKISLNDYFFPANRGDSLDVKIHLSIDENKQIKNKLTGETSAIAFNDINEGRYSSVIDRDGKGNNSIEILKAIYQYYRDK